ncbi:unnamed protein product [Acidithrix sp. C25]|nr:unnamed protein product [Acidithrix sp. C25]
MVIIRLSRFNFEFSEYDCDPHLVIGPFGLTKDRWQSVN